MTPETDPGCGLGLLLRAALVLTRQGEPLSGLVSDVNLLAVEMAAWAPESLWNVACGLRTVVSTAQDRSLWDVEADLRELVVRFRTFSSLESTFSM